MIKKTIMLEPDEIELIHKWVFHLLFNHINEANSLKKLIQFENHQIFLDKIDSQISNAHEIVNILNRKQYEIKGYEHFSKTDLIQPQKYYDFYKVKLIELIIVQLTASGQKNIDCLYKNKEKIIMTILNPYSELLRCTKCDCHMWESISFDTKEVFCTPISTTLEWDTKSLITKRVPIKVDNCSLNYDAEDYKGIIQVQKGLSFVNFFEDSHLKIENRNINYLSERYKLFLDYANLNIGYVQTSNTVVNIYQNINNKTIWIVELYANDLNNEFVLSDCVLLGVINCEMWRIMFTDSSLNNLKQHVNDAEYQEPVHVELSKGDYQITVKNFPYDGIYAKIEMINKE